MSAPTSRTVATAVISWFQRLRKLSASTAADRTVLFAFLASRAVAWGAGALALVLWEVHHNAGNFDPDGLTGGFRVGAYWDSVWFLDIARDGYEEPADAAFFPLYPLLLRLTGASLAGGVLVSLACFAGAL